MVKGGKKVVKKWSLHKVVVTRQKSGNLRQNAQYMFSAFDIKNDRKTENLNKGNGSYQLWSETSDSVEG